MPTRYSNTEPAIQRFCDKYIILLGKQGIKTAQHRWYVRHIERYISNHPNQKLVTHSTEQVSSYLEYTGAPDIFTRLAVHSGSKRTANTFLQATLC